MVQADADEVRGAVGGGAHQHAATGNKVVHLGGGKQSNHSQTGQLVSHDNKGIYSNIKRKNYMDLK